MELHWNILDKKRLDILPLLQQVVGGGFYLAGDTGLALQIGHRDSIDFDFFLNQDFDTKDIARHIESVFLKHEVAFIQEEKDTISCTIDGTVQLSFLSYYYPLQKPLIVTEFFPIASVEDIGCMKLSAITGRSVEKDYVDLYFILQQLPLAELLAVSSHKHPSLNVNLILKSLVYFDDVVKEPLIYKEGNETSFETIKAYMQKSVAQYVNVH
ncbi:MAG: nucleotidyl transferase AbiEii/AbiGii toxin family protein [bacterium]|nr:nucleotidyl transferase AbiEii/AbiGii toxin family protein [bacterium]